MKTEEAQDLELIEFSEDDDDDIHYGCPICKGNICGVPDKGPVVFVPDWMKVSCKLCNKIIPPGFKDRKVIKCKCCGRMGLYEPKV